MNESFIYGVLLDRNKEGWVKIIAGPENIVIQVDLDLTEWTLEKPITTRKELWGLCKAINENRLPCFDSQKCLSLILEKYPPESLINE